MIGIINSETQTVVQRAPRAIHHIRGGTYTRRPRCTIDMRSMSVVGLFGCATFIGAGNAAAHWNNVKMINWVDCARHTFRGSSFEHSSLVGDVDHDKRSRGGSRYICEYTATDKAYTRPSPQTSRARCVSMCMRMECWKRKRNEWNSCGLSDGTWPLQTNESTPQTNSRHTYIYVPHVRRTPTTNSTPYYMLDYLSAWIYRADNPGIGQKRADTHCSTKANLYTLYGWCWAHDLLDGGQLFWSCAPWLCVHKRMCVCVCGMFVVLSKHGYHLIAVKWVHTECNDGRPSHSRPRPKHPCKLL